MEKLVRVINQGELVTRNWQNSQGETKVIKSVELTLSDGIDTFVAEANDSLAESINTQPLDQDGLYAARCRILVREWENKDHVKVRSTSVKLINIQQV